VCTADPFCCTNTWDAECKAGALDCGADCGLDCCIQRSEGGCEDPTIEACVCGIDPVCCSGDLWDEYCTTIARNYCDAPCSSSCCQTSASPSCEDSVVSACVCALDATCCSTAWDADCVNLAIDECAAECPASSP
jgi:hypothetical protein